MVDQSLVNAQVSATVFDYFDTVLEFVQVSLSCHVSVLKQIVKPPLCVAQSLWAVDLPLKVKHDRLDGLEKPDGI